MRRKGAKDSITRSAAYSIGLHLILLFFTISSVFIPRKENNLLMDIELIGEGEFRDDMAHAPAPVDNVSVKTDPIEKIEKEQLLIREPAPLESENNKIDANISEEKEIPETVNNEIPELEKEIPEEKIEEKTPEKIEKTEEPVPQKEIKKEKKKKSKKISPKKKKNRNKKALLDVINNAEKKQRRKNHRKMLQQLVNKEEKRKRDTEFNDILSDKGYGEGSGRGRKGKGLGALGKGTGITEGDYEMISSQIYPHWIVPSGVRDAENIIIEIHVELGDNGEVIPSSIKIIDEKKYKTDHVFRAAADSAKRAILQASPLSIPREKLDLFKEITLRFNLKEALGE